MENDNYLIKFNDFNGNLKYAITWETNSRYPIKIPENYFGSDTGPSLDSGKGGGDGDLPDDVSVAAGSRLSTNRSLFTRYTGKGSQGQRID